MRGTNAKDDSENFELKNLKNDELRQEYQVKISNRFEVLESLDENVATEEETDIDKEWETIRNTIKLSASESIGYLKKRQNKKWFDEDCADIVKKRTVAKMNWLHEQN